MTDVYMDSRHQITIEVDEDIQEMSLDYMGERNYTRGRKRVRAIDMVDGTKTQWFDISLVEGMAHEQVIQFFQEMLSGVRASFEHQYLNEPYRYKPGDELRSPEFEIETIKQPDGSWIKRVMPTRTLGDEAQLYKEAEWNRINEAKKLAELERMHKLDQEKEAAARAMLHKQQQERLKAELEAVELEAVELEAIREDEPNFGAFS